MTIIGVVDFETDGADPPVAVEFGVVWLRLGKGGQVQQVGQASAPLRYRGPPAPAAQGVHHLPPALLARARHPLAVLRRHWRSDALGVAHHHAAYDWPVLCDLLRRAGLPLPPLQVCTLRAARHLWPGAPNYRLGTLRYWRQVAVKPPAWLSPHRALHDAVVTAALLRNMLRDYSLQELVRVSEPTLPVLTPTITFGEHRGKVWGEVPADYLGWMMRTVRKDPEAFDLDVRHSARTEIMRRRKVVEERKLLSQGTGSTSTQDRVDGANGRDAAQHVAGPMELHGGPHSGGLGSAEPPHRQASGAVEVGSAPKQEGDQGSSSE